MRTSDVTYRLQGMGPNGQYPVTRKYK